MAAGSHHWWLPFINCREPPNGSPFLTAGSHPSLILLSSSFLLSPFFFSPLFISCIFLLSFFLSLIFLSFFFLSFFFLYIHVFLQSPFNLKLFATFIAFKFLPSMCVFIWDSTFQNSSKVSSQCLHLIFFGWFYFLWLLRAANLFTLLSHLVHFNSALEWLVFNHSLEQNSFYLVLLLWLSEDFEQFSNFIWIHQIWSDLFLPWLLDSSTWFSWDYFHESTVLHKCDAWSNLCKINFFHTFCM